MLLKRLITPLGDMLARATVEGVYCLEFYDKRNSSGYFTKNDIPQIHEQAHAHLVRLEEQLSEYFEGRRKIFTVPLVIEGSDFQKSVWNTLSQIPYGELWSYKKQAEVLGDIKKVRAIAHADSKNKILIIIPCHRVIASNGKLSGYAGGVWRKQKLLELERSILL